MHIHRIPKKFARGSAEECGGKLRRAGGSEGIQRGTKMYDGVQRCVGDVQGCGELQWCPADR